MTEPILSDGKELVEIGRAHDRFEASIWMRQLEEQGIDVSAEKKGGWLRALLFLGRVPYVVRVRLKDRDDALAYLGKYRLL